MLMPCKQNVELLIVALSLELLSDSNCMRTPLVEQALTPSISWGLPPLSTVFIHVMASFSIGIAIIAAKAAFQLYGDVQASPASLVALLPVGLTAAQLPSFRCSTWHSIWLSISQSCSCCAQQVGMLHQIPHLVDPQ